MANYKSLFVQNRELKLRIDTKNSIALEKRLGTNPLNLLIEAQDGKIPSFEALLLIFHAALQKYQHGITIEKVYDIYDAFVEEGHDMTDFMELMIQVLGVSGYMKMENVQVKEERPAEEVLHEIRMAEPEEPEKKELW